MTEVKYIPRFNYTPPHPRDMERFSTDRNKPWNSDLPTVWKIAVSCQYPGRAENPSDIIADMEKVYQSIQKVAAKKGLTFLMLLPDITAKVSGEPVDLLEVLDVMAENQPTA